MELYWKAFLTIWATLVVGAQFVAADPGLPLLAVSLPLFVAASWIPAFIVTGVWSFIGELASPTASRPGPLR